ncbi:MAG: GNAT family N-acetyltransferase [Armatimonadota bacterium]
MLDVRFRPATPADDSFFLEMEFRTTWESLSPEDQQRLRPAEVRHALRETHELLLARPGNQVVVAEDESGRRVGLLWFGSNRNLVTGEDEAWVYNVSVAEEFQGQGIGRRLMDHAERLAQEGGFSVLGLMVSSHNLRARGLYEKLDFRPTNVLMRKTLSR